jgi:SAM-dependent methyltransferase
MLILLKKALRHKAKVSFLTSLDADCSILDVGCGNNSPFLMKSILPKSCYTGIDIGDYNQKKLNLADEYIVTSPEGFVDSIYSLPKNFDVVISSHNLEHCYDRMGTLLAMLSVLKPGGRIYLSFPSEETLNFPCRVGTLNYADDKTHQGQPPSFDEILKFIESKSFSIDFSTKNYQPFGLRILGLLMEPLSKINNRVYLGTWEYYGFESIIWARKNT